MSEKGAEKDWEVREATVLRWERRPDSEGGISVKMCIKEGVVLMLEHKEQPAQRPWWLGQRERRNMTSR